MTASSYTKCVASEVPGLFSLEQFLNHANEPHSFRKSGRFPLLQGAPATLLYPQIQPYYTRTNYKCLQCITSYEYLLQSYDLQYSRKVSHFW